MRMLQCVWVAFTIAFAFPLDGIAQQGKPNIVSEAALAPPGQDALAETVLLGGNVVTMDGEDRVVTALAIRDGHIIGVGSDQEIRRFVGKETTVVDLRGKTVIPGIIAAHCHAVSVARNELIQPHAELLSVAEVQEWIRSRAKGLPEGTWIEVPRTDITRLKERRHPTPGELDAACSTHPIIFTAARKSALNSIGLKMIGVRDEADGTTEQEFKGEVIRDANGRVRLVVGASSALNRLRPRPSFSPEQMRASLKNVHQHYNAVGITSIFERGGNIDDFLLYRQLRAEGNLSVRMTQTFVTSFRSAQDVVDYTEKLGMKTGDGDEWLRVGPLKIRVDGGIHWGNTFLREPYGDQRNRFYARNDPDYRGDLNYQVPLLTEVFREGHRLGWQLSCHVTGDGGVDAVLDAIEAIHADHPEIAQRRFSLIHAYFPTADSVARASRLGVCVDTQPSLYFKDSAAIAEIYGDAWAARFIGLGQWVRGGIPTAMAGDHMMGLDPDTAMNAYNPFLMMQVAVTRRNRDGKVYGPEQRISRIEALRCLTTGPAWLSFEETSRGSLETGKLADLAILDRDCLTCPENELAKIKVLKTMIDGRFVYESE